MPRRAASGCICRGCSSPGRDIATFQDGELRIDGQTIHDCMSLIIKIDGAQLPAITIERDAR